MFVRKKRNKSGSVSVQIISKTRGAYRVVKSDRSSHDSEGIEKLIAEARSHIIQIQRQGRLFPTLTKENAAVVGLVRTLPNTAIRTIGPEHIFGTLFDRIGFDAIAEPLFRHLVVARLAHPKSKLKTAEYLNRYRGLDIDVNDIYRFMDTLNTVHKTTVERIAFEHTKKTLGNIRVVFYDMTTLYFEAEDEDDLRKIGFSKDGKFQCPQIMIGLLVGPIGYEVFEGNTFEGKTILPVIRGIEKKYNLPKPIVVADSGLLSKSNINELEKDGYSFILGARIKNETEAMKQKILENTKHLEDG